MRKLIFIVLMFLPLFITLKSKKAKAPPTSIYEKQLRSHYSWLEQEKLRKEQQLGLFLKRLSRRESAHKWKIINRFGYMGKYQFGNAALKDIGLGYITTKKFRKNRHIFPIYLQDEAVKRLLDRNSEILKKHMKYVGCTIQGVRITKSGMLAAAHLAGAGNVKSFLEGDIDDFKDGNGTKLTQYLEEFANYQF